MDETSYMTFLLEEKFTPKNVNRRDKSKLTVKDVYNYAENLQKSVGIWYDLFNPTESKTFGEEEKIWIEKLKRIDITQFSPLLLTIYLHKKDALEITKFLKLLERYAFIMMVLSYRYVWHPTEFMGMVVQLMNQKDVSTIIKVLQERIDAGAFQNCL